MRLLLLFFKQKNANVHTMNETGTFCILFFRDILFAYTYANNFGYDSTSQFLCGVSDLHA